MWILQLLGLVLFVAVVANFDEIFAFISDLLTHGMSVVRKKLGMTGTKEE